MRIHERQQAVSLAQTHLEMALHNYQWPNPDPESEEGGIDNLEMLRAVLFEVREICLDMGPKVERAEAQSALKDLIRSFKEEHVDPQDPERMLIGLTDIELVQGLLSYCSSKMKWMLRYERHGDYEKPAGLE